jgi:hypothetical protein
MAKKKKKAVKKRVLKRKITRKKSIKRPAKKKILKKRPVKKTTKKKKITPKKAKENIIGKVTHYFPHVRAAVIKLKAPLKVGDVIKIKGHTTDFTQSITSLQIDRVPITEAKKGQEIGLLVDSRVRQHDEVFKS